MIKKQMLKKIAICPGCHTKIECEGELGEKVKVNCPNCNTSGLILFEKNLQQLDFYAIKEPFVYVKILKDMNTLEKHYKIIEPYLNEEEQKILNFIWDALLSAFNTRLDELDLKKIENYLTDQVEKVIKDYDVAIEENSKKKILYYIKRESLGFGKIDPLMKDLHIEDISCDGSGVPIFLYHRKYGSLKSNIEFKNEEELSFFVIRLAQKCGKHISIAEPMLDATMPDGSRIQMTLSTEVTTKGSTFTIRKFRADPFTPPDLVALNTVSSEILAYYWIAVENRINALIAGGTASGKTTILNALSLFIPCEAKIVSIEETREINLPHPNWIPGVARSGFGEVVADKMAGEIDMYDLMKAALRQRPEYILVGEIRGKEAYVLFQAMATGHATYSTVHADSAKSLIHRLEGKPIEIPRIMLQSLDIVSIHVTTRIKGKRVRRCKQIIEIIDIDPTTKEILTNEVFRWDSVEDKFIYTGKSYVLEGIRARWEMTKEDIAREVRNRAEILEWMNKKDVRTYREVAKIFSRYTENPKDFMEKMRNSDKNIIEKKDDKKVETQLNSINISDSPKDESNETPLIEPDENQKSNNKKYNDFNTIKSIDEETATLLKNNGILTIYDLNNKSLKDLMKIKGIKKKTIKNIKEEIEQENKDKPNDSKTLIKKDFGFKLNKNKKIIVFKNFKSINEKTAFLLFDNGIKTIEELYKLTLDDLLKITGIKRKTANKIIDELYNNILIKRLPLDTDNGDEMDATK
ncbi:hypothetical protein AYK20_05400 [Thermoplasmatales archaeon SG8-52-1]|nr:MAG: hypothetical protein AYK20_05400 [Thermoplasmatales archaeon SG8-52-1]